MNPVINERITALARAVRSAGHGAKGELIEAAAAELQLSKATVHRKLATLTVTTPRKRRTDAGQHGLTRDEALMIAGVMMESRRGNNKRLYSLNDAVDHLRCNGMLRAERINTDTGEVLPLSYDAIRRAMRSYGVHPEQLSQPDPHVEMASEHPNHVWQIDASLCVLYYLKPNKGPNGLHVMDGAEFYKNKPANVARVMADRVWSYEITDHASGWIYVEYVMGAESGENLCNVLINALQERGGADMLHGVPRILYMDPGSANTSAMAKNLCKALGITALAHAAGNARATGQVENARNIIERKFESGLRFRPVADLAELNSLAAQWRAVFNATAKHSRTNDTRSNVWMRITQQQLIKAPSIAVCRELAVATPVERKVTPKLRVNFNGAEYDVSAVPLIMVGQAVLITRNPWRSDAAQLVTQNIDGNEVFYVLPQVEKNEYGFATTAPVWGEGFASQAHTPTQTAKADIDKLMTGSSSAAEADAARKAKAIPLAGKFNPYKPLDDAQLPTYMPRRGTEHSLKAPVIETPVLQTVELAMRLRERLGSKWTPEHFAWLTQRYPQGAKEDALDSIAQQLLKPTAALRVVGGA
ncbi:integrase catalytic domain-containing protein [Rheinheimera maricola]|uniref:Transposase family protein n=1 Tax=Rheinheimera maricola TaxID=2793282 RepID=A0ABS7X5F7_9GAMM|nr:DDE-type integrase/transposase/recombinase [Rheinheimera maricola]MBZ9610778.1 transposase family protein [Rheinheimera maricola]